MSGGGGSVPYWQERLTKVVERDRFLLKEGKFTDVVFLVGEEAREFHCHRLYLAKTSPAFESMLYGVLASPLGEPIRIPDATPGGFQALLTYIYEGKVELKTFSAASGLLQLSKKYLLPQELQQQCRAQCWTLIYPRAVWQAIQFASENREDTILDTAWQVVCRESSVCLKLVDLCELPENMLLQVVQQENLSCTELELYQACVRWGKAEIVRRDLPESEQGLRTALANILPHIRFLAMENKDLYIALKPPRFVTNDEALNLLMLKNSEDEPSKLTAKTALTGFNLLPEPRAEKDFKTFQVEGCPPDLLCLPVETHSSFFVFTSDMTIHDTKQSHNKHIECILLPSQVKAGALEGETYEEEVTLNVYTFAESEPLQLLLTEKFKGAVPYNGFCIIPFNVKPCCHANVTKGSRTKFGSQVILHKSGSYPYSNGRDIKKSSDTMLALKKSIGMPKVKANSYKVAPIFAIYLIS